VQRPADCHFANFDFLKHIPSRQKRGEGRDSCFEMQYHRANPVSGRIISAMHWFLIIRPVMTQKKTPENRFMRTGVVAQTALPSVTAKQAMVRQDSERTEVNRGIREAWSGSKYVAVS
ncbi:hypothetical protein, partial [Shigella flexneri]